MVSLPSVPADWGWLIAISWVVWQVYAPKVFGVETRFEEVVNSLNDRIDNVANRIEDIEDHQRQLTIVTEIIAIETENVDGNEVTDLFREETSIDRDNFRVDDKYGGHPKHDK